MVAAHRCRWLTQKSLKTTKLEQIRLVINSYYWNWFQTHLKEETENGLKETRADLLSIGDELERNRMSLLTLQNGAANETLQVCRHDNQHHIIDLKLQSVQQQLTNLQLNVTYYNNYN